MKNDNNISSNSGLGSHIHRSFPVIRKQYVFRGTLRHTCLTDSITVGAYTQAEAEHKASTFADNLTLERIEDEQYR